MTEEDRAALENANLQYPVRVLFLCNGNSARSQIAEALLVKRGGERFVVASAGANPAAEVRPEAVVALRQIGVDWTGHRPRGISAVKDEPWDLVITLCDRTWESCPAFPSRPITAHWGVPDPAAVTDRMRLPTAFSDTLQLLMWRIDLMLSLGNDSFTRLVYQERLRAIPLHDPPLRTTKARREDRP
ncbi:MAG TPA: arsenate reductase ArsC [Gemmatimonadaceae bacterium]|jgi:protein-tyrosine-phosphatase